jgi:hypothetical protein
MSIITHFPFLQSDLLLKCPTFEIPTYVCDKNRISYCYQKLLRHNMKHNISFFRHGESVKHQMMGKYDDLCYIQLYKFAHHVEQPMYVLMTSYIGSCDGCFHSRFQHTFDNTGSLMDMLREVVLYNVSKCEVLYDETTAIKAYEASEQRIFNSNATV